jgi:hypothetical protein
VNVCLTSHTATGSARDRQHRHPAARLNDIKAKRPFSGPQFSPKKRNKMALYRTPVFAASQPANRYAERTAWYPAGAPGFEQFRRPATKLYVFVAVNTDIPQIY